MDIATSWLRVLCDMRINLVHEIEAVKQLAQGHTDDLEKAQTHSGVFGLQSFSWYILWGSQSQLQINNGLWYSRNASPQAIEQSFVNRGRVQTLVFFKFPHKAMGFFFLIIFHRINCFGQMPGHDTGNGPTSSLSFCYSFLLLELIHHMVFGMMCHLLGYTFHRLSSGAGG